MPCLSPHVHPSRLRFSPATIAAPTSPGFALAAAFLFVFSFAFSLAPSAGAAPAEELGADAGETGATAAINVGAYYYPWWNGRSNQWDRQVPRLNLDPPQVPVLGRYRSADPDVIAGHLDQSQRGGISFWAVSWWGPDSPTDRVFREQILNHERAGELNYAVLYESEGRFGGLRNPDFTNWESDLAYLAEHYFDDPNYLEIDGRPVLFVYLTRALFRGDRGDAPLDLLREKFPDVYLVGDEVFGAGYRPEWVTGRFDAITAYDVYGQSAKRHGSNPRAVEALAENYRDAKSAAAEAGAGFIPVVAPGYNDSLVRPGNHPAPRYFADVEGSKPGDVFRSMLDDAALPNLDPTTGNVLLVTSFNEWYEDTQIEATTGDQPTTTRDSSDDGESITRGYRYADDGYLYLDLLREHVDRWAAGAAREAD